MSADLPRVLLDLSVLATDTRARGIGRYVGDLARGLSAVAHPGLEVWGVTSMPWLADAVVTTRLATAVDRLVADRNPYQAEKDWAFRLRVRLAPTSRKLGASLLHTGHPLATPLGDPGCPRVTTCHDLIPQQYPRHYAGLKSGFGWGRRLLDRRRFRSADHVICVSRATADDLMRLLEVPASRISVVHNGVDLGRWSAAPADADAEVLARHGLSAGGFALCVGGMDWRKNAEGTLRAFALARRRSEVAALKLVWAGKLSAPAQRQLRARAHELGINGLVLPGFVGDTGLAALYRGAVTLLFVSRAEGFGYPIIEAMAAGCPVITSSCSSMAELAGEAAITVDPEDHAVIAEAIVALTDATERARWCEAGGARAQHFTLERMVKGTLDVYRSQSRG